MFRLMLKLGGAILAASSALPASADAQLQPLNGEWITDCVPIGKNGRHGTIIRLTIRDGALRADSQLYARNTCQNPTVRSVFEGAITVVRDETINAVPLEIEIKEMLTIPNATEVVAHYNQPTEDQAGCGITEWEINAPVSTAGLKCGPLTWPAIGARLYDHVWVRETEMQFGALPFNWGNTSPELRPDQPSEVIFYRTGL